MPASMRVCSRGGCDLPTEQVLAKRYQTLQHIMRTPREINKLLLLTRQADARELEVQSVLYLRTRSPTKKQQDRETIVFSMSRQRLL